jgi:hypothetical protein
MSFSEITLEVIIRQRDKRDVFNSVTISHLIILEVIIRQRDKRDVFNFVTISHLILLACWTLHVRHSQYSLEVKHFSLFQQIWRIATQLPLFSATRQTRLRAT